MAATTPSDALVLAWNLEREVHNRPDSRQKAVITGLLTLATTAAYLAHDLASKSTHDTLHDYYDVLDQMGLGIEAAEIALTEAIESFDPEATTKRPLPMASLSAKSGSGGKATPQPSEETYSQHPSELESDPMPPERMIELIAGHVQTRLETSLVSTLIHPLTKALIGPLTDALMSPLTNALSQLLTVEHTVSAGDAASEQRSLGQLPSSLVDDGVSFKVVKSPAKTLRGSSACRATALDPVATASSGFSRQPPPMLYQLENTPKKRRTFAPP